MGIRYYPSGSGGVPTTAPRITAIFDTDVSTAVGDLVYLTGTNFVSTLPDNDPATIPNGLFGVAFSKPSTTTVEVLFIGILGGYVGLTAGSPCFIDTDGTPTQTGPITGILQQIGQAISATQIFFLFLQPVELD